MYQVYLVKKMTRKPIPEEINEFIRKNKGIYSNRKMSREILKEFDQKVSYEYVRKYLSDDNIKVVNDKKKSHSKSIGSLPQKPQNKKFIKFPATSNQLIELLKKKQGEGKADYLLRQYEGPGRNKTLLMHTIEFVIDHFK